MAVYVDDANIQATVPNGRARHTSLRSHLFADSQEELHEFAAQLGLRRSFFQGGPKHGPFWHYDVTAGKRQQAIRLGAQPVSWREAAQISLDREARAERARVADQASRAAGLAYRAGDYTRASQLLGVSREADPSRAPVWAERAARVHAAAHERAAEVAGPDDPRPLGEVVAARMEAAGIGADDPGVQFARAWNAERQAAAAGAESGPDGEPARSEPDAEVLPDLLDEREAAQ
jgi:Protein of unknown function (DUF4031)